MKRPMTVRTTAPSYDEMTPAELTLELETLRETRNRTIDPGIRTACDAVEKRLLAALEEKL